MPTRSSRYRVHGLTIDSEIELPELPATTGDVDVTIRLGAVPDALGGTVSRGRCYAASGDQCLIELPRVARYWVTGGRDVVIAPAPGARHEDVRVFVFSSVMGAVAHQRGLLVMHACAVDIDGDGVLFLGQSGAGKSTLTAACHDLGFRVVTDDLSVITFDTAGAGHVQSGYRHIKLWADARTVVGASLGASRQMRIGMRKLHVTIPGTAESPPVRVAHVYSLTNRPAGVIELRPVAGRAKVTVLLRDTYRRRMSVALGQRNRHFAQCSALARGVRLVEVRRPDSLAGVHALAEAIVRDVRGARA